MTSFREPYVPALIEIRLGAEASHRVRHFHCEVALKADLEQFDLAHPALPSVPLYYVVRRRCYAGMRERRNPRVTVAKKVNKLTMPNPMMSGLR